jgi:hypothetical protein
MMLTLALASVAALPNPETIMEAGMRANNYFQAQPGGGFESNCDWTRATPVNFPPC